MEAGLEQGPPSVPDPNCHPNWYPTRNGYRSGSYRVSPAVVRHSRPHPDPSGPMTPPYPDSDRVGSVRVVVLKTPTPDQTSPFSSMPPDTQVFRTFKLGFRSAVAEPYWDVFNREIVRANHLLRHTSLLWRYAILVEYERYSALDVQTRGLPSIDITSKADVRLCFKATCQGKQHERLTAAYTLYMAACEGASALLRQHDLANEAEDVTRSRVFKGRGLHMSDLYHYNSLEQRILVAMKNNIAHYRKYVFAFVYARFADCIQEAEAGQGRRTVKAIASSAARALLAADASLIAAGAPEDMVAFVHTQLALGIFVDTRYEEGDGGVVAGEDAGAADDEDGAVDEKLADILRRKHYAMYHMAKAMEEAREHQQVESEQRAQAGLPRLRRAVRIPSYQFAPLCGSRQTPSCVKLTSRLACNIVGRLAPPLAKETDIWGAVLTDKARNGPRGWSREWEFAHEVTCDGSANMSVLFIRTSHAPEFFAQKTDGGKTKALKAGNPHAFAVYTKATIATQQVAKQARNARLAVGKAREHAAHTEYGALAEEHAAAASQAAFDLDQCRETVARARLRIIRDTDEIGRSVAAQGASDAEMADMRARQAMCADRLHTAITRMAADATQHLALARSARDQARKAVADASKAATRSRRKHTKNPDPGGAPLPPPPQAPPLGQDPTTSADSNHVLPPRGGFPYFNSVSGYSCAGSFPLCSETRDAHTFFYPKPHSSQEKKSAPTQTLPS